MTKKIAWVGRTPGKRKTIAELKEDKWFWRFISIIFIVGFVIMSSLFLYSINQKDNLKSQLQECGEDLLNVEENIFEVIHLNFTYKPSWMGYSEDEIPEDYIKLIVYEKSCGWGGEVNNCVYYKKEVYFPENYEVIE